MPSAAVVRFPTRRAAKRQTLQPDDQPTLKDRERASTILKEAATFTACICAYDGVWNAERTGDGLLVDIVGDRFWHRAQSALVRLTRLIRKADENSVMTVELRSLAAVAGFMLDREREHGHSSDVSLDGSQVDLLRAFATLVDRVGQKRYAREYAEG